MLLWLIIILVVSFLLLITIVVMYIRQLRNKRRVIKQELKLIELENEFNQVHMRNLEQEKELEQEKYECLRKDLQIKEQELVYSSLKQANASLINASVRAELAPFISRFTRKKDREDFSRALEEIYLETHHDPLDDFEQMFVQMHGGFYEKLIAINPEFTRTELQLCALLRMNLPSKEMAALMNLSLSRIDQLRHQVRLKLGLKPGQNLIGFLITMQAGRNFG